jgi:tetratricopeptide (TPR) repeat protein
MISFDKIQFHSKKIRVIILLTFILGIGIDGYSQSPKKLLENGFYEQAFANAVYKQNKKVKLKKKFTEVIFPAYDLIYANFSKTVASEDATWQQSYNAFILVSKYRKQVTHAGVKDKLKNILYDKTNLDNLGTKFNDANQNDINEARTLESKGKFDKALELYKAIGIRHKQVAPITTLKDRILIIDFEEMIENTNRKIGDQLIAEATEKIAAGSVKNANKAIELIEKARRYRPLDSSEEALLELAHLIKSNSMMDDAKKMMNTPTKKNARLAFELIERVRSMRTLSPEEERLSERARDWGTTRILVTVKGTNPVNSKESLSGFLNDAKKSKWISYYYSKSDAASFDFEMEVTENQPKVVLGKRQKKISQQTKQVEYFEDETDSLGNTTQVKKTRTALAIVAVLSRTKTASLSWSIVLKDLSGGKAAFSETTDSKIEITNEFASLESGDVLALPENIETDVDLDSQPFPTDKEMLQQVKQLYLSELISLLNSREFHLHNLNVAIERQF